MELIMLGLSHESAGVAVREQVTFAGESLAAGLAALMELPEILEGAILSTCNRTEIYAVVTDPAAGRKALRGWMSEFKGLSAEVLSAYFFWLDQVPAIAHLFRVTAGLESQILGEGQICHQVKEAHAAARDHRAIGAILDGLFRAALAAGKRSRSETDIARGAVSVSSAAIELAKERLGGLEDRTLLVLGTGKMGELAAKQLRTEGLKKAFFASRTFEHAERLAAEAQGTAIPFVNVAAVLVEVDLVFCCTGAPHHVLSAADLAPLLARREGRPLVMIDVSVPRNLDPALATLPDVTVCDLDDLRAIAARHRAARASVVREVESILSTEVAAFQQWLRTYALSPTITSWRSKVHATRAAELDRFWQRHAAKFTPDQRQLIDALAQSLLNKVMHGPLARLKEMSGLQQQSHASSLMTLFDLQVDTIEERYRRRPADYSA